MMYVTQIIMLHTLNLYNAVGQLLNLYNAVCQLYLNKSGRKSKIK